VNLAVKPLAQQVSSELADTVFVMNAGSIVAKDSPDLVLSNRALLLANNFGIPKLKGKEHDEKKGRPKSYYRKIDF